MSDTSKIVCFLHSCTLDLWGTTILEYIVNYIHNKGLLDKLQYLFVNNTGKEIKTDMFSNISDKIVIINYSSDPSVFENCTLRYLYFFSQINPDYKILYLHTKGVSHSLDHPFVHGIRDWIDFMLYSLVHHHNSCLEMLNYVDAIGCDYRCKPHEKENPNHFSGNFWWANSNYIRTLSVYKLSQKYDAEFWLLQNDPPFIHIHKCPYGHYENQYKVSQYGDIVEKKMASILDFLRNFNSTRILYGVEGNYMDVTDICHSKLRDEDLIKIPGGDMERNTIFTDPIFGTVKHIRIGNMTYSYNENMCFRLNKQS